MGNVNCCNISNDKQGDEYKFENINQIRQKTLLDQSQEVTKTNQKFKSKINENNIIKEEEKSLYIEIESHNHEYKDKIVITPNGLIGTNRIKKEEDECTYFGYKYNDEALEIDYCLPKSQLIDNSSENDSNNNNLKNATQGIFFKIQFQYPKHKYYLQDMGIGYGTFVKIEETTLKENSIVNIGDTYLVFSFCIPTELSLRKDTDENENNFNKEELYLKIYSGKNKYDPIVFHSFEQKVFTIGRLEKCDVPIKDKMLSRIHCNLFYNDGNWFVRDGNIQCDPSTNGTWLFAYEETEIEEGMIFKSNSCNFYCSLKQE